MSQLICRRVCIALLVLAGMASAMPAAAQTDFYTVPGCRVYDSRVPSDPGPDGPLAMGTVYTVSVAGQCGVPADATAVALNVTVVGANTSGYLAVFPAGTTPPFVEMLAFKAGRTQAVLQLVGLSVDGDLSFEANPSSAPPPPPQYHFVIDVIGYYLNFPPVLTAGGVLNYTEDDPPTAIDTTITVADADDANLQSATVQITGNYVNGQDVLSFVDTANITGVFTAATGTLQLTGSDTLANWQTALRSVLYENTSDSPSTAARTVTWIADDGADESAPVTSTINVTAHNDAPAGTDNAVSTPENTDYVFTTADFGFSDPNDVPANALLAVTITTLPGAGSLTLSGGAVSAGQSIPVADIAAGNLKFTPVTNANGSPYATFTFQVQDDGGTASGGVDLDPTPNTMTINVTGVNNAPAGTDGAVSTPEDVQYTFTAADFGFTDPLDTPPNNFASVVIATLPGVGSLTLSDSGFAAGTEITVGDINAGNLKFTPVANASGSPYTTFTFQVRDDGGTAGGGVDLDPSANTMTINVTAVNDAPAGTNNAVNTPEDTQYTFTAADFGFTDPNDTPANNLLAVKITTLPAAGTLTLSGSGFAAGTDISVANITAGNLKFTPAANAFGSPYTTFTFQVQDDGGTAGGGVDLDPTPNTMTINVTAVNDAPAGTDNTVSTPEDTQYTFTAADFGFTDPNDTPANNLASVVVTTLPGLGSLTLSGGGFAAGTEITVADITAGNLKFAPAANGSGTPYTTFTFQVRDDGGTAGGGVDLDPTPNTMTINVNGVNDAPAGTNGSVNAFEDTQYTFTAANFGFTDPNDTPPNALASVIITTLPAAGSLTLSGSGFAAGTEITVADITAGNLKFLAAANASGSPYTTFTFQVRDDGGTAGGGVDLDPSANTMTINVAAVNDAPAGTDNTVTTPEDVQYTFSAADFGFTDPNDSPANNFASVVITTLPGAGSLTLSGSPFAAGTEILVANIPNLKFQGAANAFGSPYTSFTFQVRDDGGTANGGVNLDPTPNTITINVTPVNDPPLFVDATLDYSTVGNTQLRAGELATGASVAHVRDNLDLGEKSTPNDIDGPAPPFTYSLATPPANGQATVNSNGTFTYEPNAGFAGPTDTFTVAVSDGGPLPNTSNLSVTVTISEMVWYIHDVVAPANPDNPAGGDGRSTNAFDTITAFNAATTANGNIIFIFEGNTGTTPLTGSITLKDGQKLWGQGIALNVPGFGTPLVNATNRPRIRTTAASTDVVSVPATSGSRTNVEIRGLDLEATGATSNAIDVTSSGANTVGVTISNNNIRGATAEGIDLNSGATNAFSATVQSNTITSAGNGIDTRANSTGTATVMASSNMITSTAGNAFDARTLAGASALRVAFDNGNVSAAGNGIVIDGSAAGTTTITGFANNLVDVTTLGSGINVTSAIFDATPGAPFNLVNGGTVMIGASGNGVGQGGMVLTAVQGDLSFTDLDIYNDAGPGLSVSSTGAINVGAGTGFRLAVTANAATIDSTGGPAVSVNNASFNLPTMSFLRSTNSTTTGLSLVNAFGGAGSTTLSASSGEITDPGAASGTAVNIDGGNGNITLGIPITNNSGRSVSITNRTSDTISFTNTINDTGSGVFMNSNTGAVMSYSGGLTINTGTNAAFTATGGGTVSVTGSINTLKTTSGTALTVTATTIGASGLTFQCISAGRGNTGGSACDAGAASGSPTNGIVLNNTGSSGGLSVTGTAAANSGGTIQNTTGAGISLTNTRSVSLNRMNLQTIGDSGVNGTQVTNFTFTNGTINNAGNAGEESAIAFNGSGTNLGNNIAGTLTITGNTFTNPFYSGVDVQSDDGVLNSATISNNIITNPGFSGVNLVGNGSATTAFTLNNASITQNNISASGSNGIQLSGGNGNAAGPRVTLGIPNDGANVISITNNAISIDGGGTQAITAAVTGGNSGQRTRTNFDISNNGTPGSPITGSLIGTVILIGCNGYSDCTGIVHNNVIDANHTAGPGGGGGNGIGGGNGVGGAGNAWTPNLTLTVTNNVITDVNGNGILLVGRGATGTMKLKIANNNVQAPNNTPGGSARQGIRVDAGNAASADDAVYLNIFGNTSAGSNAAAGLGVRKQGAVSTTNDFGIFDAPGGSDLPAVPTTTDVQNFINALNPAGGGTDIISGSNYQEDLTQSPP